MSAPPLPSTLAFRRFQAEDAEGIVRCALRVYGRAYPRPEIYSPEAIVERNGAGAWISIVACDARGEVIAHAALEPSPFGPTAELGMALVLPEHRGHALVERLRDLALVESRARGYGGQYVEIATGNRSAQAVAARGPSRPTALTLGLWPDFTSSDSASPPARRLSFIRLFRYLERPAKITAHVPSHHADIVTRIYADLDVPLTLRTPSAPAGRARIVVEPHPTLQTTFITVPEVGSETFAHLDHAHQAFARDPDLVCATLELPLAQPGTAPVCAHAERLGFFFNGVAPCGATDGDALRLQCLKPGVALSTGELLDPATRALADYVAAARRAR
ncbi:Hypothetical protein A7982_06939 [Minicystis rosea]|nr:Hypothetical protein A7982_06939 [Minicystis rosea]